MAFSGWLSYCSITIPSSATTSASASVSGMPVLLNASNFPPAILSATGGCLATGADIRFSTTSGGSDSLPREIVNINKTSGVIAVYVKVPVITKGSNTTLWCFWNNSTASEPGKGDPAQLELVWSDFYGVFNFQGVTNKWKGINDSSGQYTNMSVIGTAPIISAGPVVGTSATVLTTAVGMSYNELVSFPATASVSAQDFSFWINQNGTASTGTFGLGTNGIQYGLLTAGQFGLSWGLFATTGGAIPATGWHHIYCRGVNGTYTIYVNGVQNNSGGSSGGLAFTTFGLGTTASPATPVSISDFRMTRNINFAVDAIKLTYVNVTNIAGFAKPGTPVTQSAQVSLTFTGLVSGTEVRIYDAGTTTENGTGVESSTTTYTYNYSYTGDKLVDITIFNLKYIPIRYTNFTLGSTNNTIPIQQQFDRNYINPA